MEDAILKKILSYQRSEATEHIIYARLSRATKNPANRDVLKRIADDELRHYGIWKKYSGRDAAPDILTVWKYYFISRLLGLTFGVKLMEKGEKLAQGAYGSLGRDVPDAEAIKRDEEEHEKELIKMIDEESLKYVGSVVLGLNDALVELTGALAGFTLALQNTRLVATAGLVTGIAASLSMCASAYLSARSDEGGKDPVKSAIYTGAAYILTVFFLILPFMLLNNSVSALSVTLVTAILIIYMFTFYVSVAKDLPFRRRFLEMALVSLGVAAITFGIGFLIRKFLNIEA